MVVNTAKPRIFDSVVVQSETDTELALSLKLSRVLQKTICTSPIGLSDCIDESSGHSPSSGDHARGLAADVMPGLDAANLIPFGSDLLLQDWYGEPYILQTVLNDYPRLESSSESEGTLYTATRALARRAGTKAIVVMTDAATGAIELILDASGSMLNRLHGKRHITIAKAIETLQTQGIEVEHIIVGFAIDDSVLAAQFQTWAELGGGRYFSAGDQAGLRESIEAALQIPFSVYDPSGTLVQSGLLDGDPIALDQGYYRVVVQTSPPQSFSNVAVVGQQAVTLEAGGSGN